MNHNQQMLKTLKQANIRADIEGLGKIKQIRGKPTTKTA